MENTASRALRSSQRLSRRNITPPLSLNGLLALTLALVAGANAPVRAGDASRPLAALASYPQRSAPATVLSLNQPDISAQISARVEAIPVQVGDRVAPGQLLVRLDCTDQELNRRGAEARLAAVLSRKKLAQDRLDRAISLVRNQLLSEDELDARRSEFDILAADEAGAGTGLKQAQVDVSRCNVQAPFAALVLNRLASVGQLAAPGTPLVRIVSVDNLEVSAQVYAADADQLASARDLQLRVNGDSLPLTLRVVLDAVNPVSRNREVRLTFDGKPGLPGAAGKLVWRDPRPHLGPEYLVNRDGRLGVFTDDDGSARFLELPRAQPGRTNPVDLPPDTLIVTDGVAGLEHGERLEPRLNPETVDAIDSPATD